MGLLIGTRKGLFALDDGGELRGPFLEGWAVYHAVSHEGVVYAAANSPFFGATVQRSADGGETWERAEGLGLPEESGLTLNAAWHVEPAGSRLWLGCDPGALFSSEDGGVNWIPNAALLEHPTRERWEPGAGGLCLHSIQVAPDGTLYIAISAAGAFRSDDGGETFTPINKDVAADFMPDDKYPEVGQCVHKLLVHPARPERLWQQNHCGVYRSDDRGDNWHRLDGNGLPSDFGFGIALDPADPDAAWVIPEEGAANRVTVGGRMGVYRTRDGGETWELDAHGLPERAWTGVLREGAAFDADGVYFGTQSGSVFARRHDAGGWEEATSQLPQILSVEAGAWS